jgi:hypothetical protein
MMSLDAKKGDKVVYLDRGGYESDREFARLLGLVKGEIYTVDSVDADSFTSDVYLVEVPSRPFNTVMFDDYKEDTHGQG